MPRVSKLRSIRVMSYAAFVANLRRDLNLSLERETFDATLLWVNVRIKEEQRLGNNMARVGRPMNRPASHAQLPASSTDVKSRFKDLLDNVALMAVTVNPRAQITYCNEYFSQLTGWTFNELQGQFWHEVFVPTVMDEAALFSAERFNDTSDAWRVEKDILTRSGERRSVRW